MCTPEQGAPMPGLVAVDVLVAGVAADHHDALLGRDLDGRMPEPHSEHGVFVVPQAGESQRRPLALRVQHRVELDQPAV